MGATAKHDKTEHETNRHITRDTVDEASVSAAQSQQHDKTEPERDKADDSRVRTWRAREQGNAQNEGGAMQASECEGKEHETERKSGLQQ